MNKLASGGVAPGVAPPHFALALGDNFYSHGISTDMHDPRFRESFESVYTGSSLQAPFTFHVVAGNHDHIGNVTAQIAYSALSKRWSFPTEYYTITEKGPEPDSPTVQVVLIDTVVMAGASDVLDARGRITEALPGSALRGPASRAAAVTQLQWLKTTLANSTADYLIVAGHYPVYSVCEHGPTPELIAQVKPLLEQYRVTAYMAGHDHCMEYLRETDATLDHHGVGSAHSNDPSTAHMDAVPKGSLRWHLQGADGGFASVVVTSEGLTVSHHQGDGTVAFTAPAHPPRKAGPYPPPPPTPPPPPAPKGWTCQAGKHLGHKALAKLALTDDDLETGSTIAACETLCTQGCSAIEFHTTDNHCHLIKGAASPSAITAALTTTTSDHTVCVPPQ